MLVYITIYISFYIDCLTQIYFDFYCIYFYRLASKTTPNDEPGAFTAREWLRKLVVGKSVRFETRKQGASAGDRVYGWLFLDQPNGEPTHLAIECVRLGHATPKAAKFPGAAPTTTDEPNDDAKDPVQEDDYESKLLKAYKEAQEHGNGIHDTKNRPLVRNIKTAGMEFVPLSLVENCQRLVTNKRLRCVIEYVFDGTRFRCQVIDDALPDFQYAIFTVLLAGVTSPRIGNPTVVPPIAAEPYSQQARQFATSRLLQRELDISLLGTDKNGLNVAGTIHHPAGNIAVELLKNGLARMTDWSLRMMAPGDVPALRFAENNAKRTLQGVWHSYAPPKLTTASQLRGTVVEAISGDTVLILPDGVIYDSESKLIKISLASIRAPRIGSAVVGRSDEPYALECKDRLRALTVGKQAEIDIHYEREIPIKPGENEKRSFATISVPKFPDIAEVLLSEGLVATQRHRDDDEKSSHYDELRAAEATATASKTGVHKEGEYKKATVNDLTDPKKAKAYSGSLMRSGTLKVIVDYVFNGALFKMFVPSENCYIRFAPNNIRCPQPSPSPGSKQPTKGAEPFGDQAKFYARLNVLQRQVEINCTGVTTGGVIVGNMFTSFGKPKIDYTIELLGVGLATVDQRKIDYGEAPKSLIDAQDRARENKIGLWSLDMPKTIDSTANSGNQKFKDNLLTVRMSEIRSGSHIFYQVAGDNSLKVIDDSMKLFTQTNGTAGAPCDSKVGKVVAALFDDGTGKRWYRAKVIEKKGPGKASVLFVDYGNLAAVPISTHLRPLDMNLGVDRIPPVAHEAILALVVTRPLSTDEGVDAARFLNSMCWEKDLVVRTIAPDENGKMTIALSQPGTDGTINAQLISEGLARVAPKKVVDTISYRTVDNNYIVSLAADMNVAQEIARKSRLGMWRYGDIGDDDPNEL